MNLKDGEKLVKYARSLTEALLSRKSRPERPSGKAFQQKKGAFCTFYKTSLNVLRGCMGIAYPDYPLIEAVEKAVKMAIKDPRFSPLRKEEMPLVKVEISVLDEPEEISLEDARQLVEIGKHGLIVIHELGAGLLLPQVAVEHEWNVEQFLENLAWKAGIHPSELRRARLFRFSAEVFAEETPGGKVVKVLG